MGITLTNTDYLAIERGDAPFLNDKGAKYYTESDYEKAIEYYRLAAAMGCVHSISNLGYCYMYGRSIPRNMSLAMAYFRAAAQKGDIDAMYKLGNIYEKGADGVPSDQEMAVYYYRLAIRTIEEDYNDPERYPSLYLSVGKAYMPGGMMFCDLKGAYQLLQIAKRGYEIEKAEGVKFHAEAYAEVLRLLDDACFDSVRDELEDDEEDEE